MRLPTKGISFLLSLFPSQLTWVIDESEFRADEFSMQKFRSGGLPHNIQLVRLMGAKIRRERVFFIRKD